MFRCAVKRTCQVVAYLSAKLKPGTSTALRGHIVGKISALKPHFVPIIPGSKEAAIQMTGALCERELWFLYTVSLLIEIYLPVQLKFQHVVVVFFSGQNLSVKNNKRQ